jgi:oligoendopeptidase F
MPTAVPARSEIPIEHTWDLEAVYPSPSAWEAAYRDIEDQLVALQRFRGHLGDGPAALADWFDTADQLNQVLRRVFLYASMSHTADTGNEAAKALYDRTVALAARAGAATAFAEPEIIAIGFDTLRRWIADEARLRIYDHYIDILERNQEHVRSAEVEEVLGMVGDPFGIARGTHGILVDTDLRFAPARGTDGQSVDLAQGNYHALMDQPDRELRRSAWESYADAHLAMQHTLANALTTGVKQHVFTARVRRYGSSLEAALGPMHLPTEVFHNLIAVFRRNLPTWHRYWDVRRRALDVDQLFPYDVWAPLTAESPTVSYDQAVEWIVEGMRPLGDEYAETVRRGALDERWVDRYPNQGKRSGAFSTGAPGTPPFILMSYTDNLFSMSTLAHEFGHSMHSFYTRRTQPTIYQWYGTFLAEVASNFNQAMVRAFLLDRHDDPSFQIAVIEEAMYNFHRYFFVMPTLARFELEIHERAERNEALTAATLNSLMAALFREAYGDEVGFDEQRVGITWAEFPTHLYLNFYVWQYATGIAAASALASAVLEEGEPAAQRYLEFLRAGGSRYPLETLQLAGVDMRSPEPVERAFGVFAALVDRLDRLVSARQPAHV